MSMWPPGEAGGLTAWATSYRVSNVSCGQKRLSSPVPKPATWAYRSCQVHTGKQEDLAPGPTKAGTTGSAMAPEHLCPPVNSGQPFLLTAFDRGWLKSTPISVPWGFKALPSLQMPPLPRGESALRAALLSMVSALQYRFLYAGPSPVSLPVQIMSLSTSQKPKECRR